MGGNDYLDASNYHRITVTPTCLCGDKICAVYADSNGHQPVNPLSTNLQSYITEALLTGQLQPEQPYGSKKYVYLRD